MTKDRRHQCCTDILHQHLNLKPFDITMEIETAIQISAWINHDGRRFDRHYELLFLAKDIKSEKFTENGKAMKGFRCHQCE